MSGFSLKFAAPAATAVAGFLMLTADAPLFAAEVQLAANYPSAPRVAALPPRAAGAATSGVQPLSEPVWGLISAARLNVRTGPGADFRIVTTLSGGDRIRVTGKDGEWLEIDWPSGAPAWISKDFVAADGTVIGNNVRIRAQGHPQSPVLREVDSGERLTIVGSAGNWYKIEAPAGSRAYVYGKYAILGVEGPAPSPAAVAPAPAAAQAEPAPTQSVVSAPAEPPAALPPLELAASPAPAKVNAAPVLTVEPAAPVPEKIAAAEPPSSVEPLPEALVAPPAAAAVSPAMPATAALKEPEPVVAAAPAAVIAPSEIPAPPPALAAVQTPVALPSSPTAPLNAPVRPEPLRAKSASNKYDPMYGTVLPPPSDVKVEPQAYESGRMDAAAGSSAASLYEEPEDESDWNRSGGLVGKTKSTFVGVGHTIKGSPQKVAETTSGTYQMVAPKVTTPVKQGAGAVAEGGRFVGHTISDGAKTGYTKTKEFFVGNTNEKEEEKKDEPKDQSSAASGAEEASPAGWVPVAELAEGANGAQAPDEIPASMLVAPVNNTANSIGNSEPTTERMAAVDVSAAPAPSSSRSSEVREGALPVPTGAAPKAERLPAARAAQVRPQDGQFANAEGYLEPAAFAPVEGATHRLVSGGSTQYYLAAERGVDLDGLLGRKVSVSGAFTSSSAAGGQQILVVGSAEALD